ncbi:hypothetical protein [Mucilaginibacter agri]|uniref:Uncharacterized protein n=1 Tax=Mucilaginibacter agri TaxID=2695265 RepID=A0A965ZEJ8_9SPHI|nr:hypothetical protein [Mucilaginibacter agri]NCD68327.1 hypothetical protein [Mucilaginibacter agri]
MRSILAKRKTGTVGIVAIALFGVVAAAAITYLYEKKRAIKMDLKPEKNRATDYMEARIHKKKKQKTDLQNLEHLVVH